MATFQPGEAVLILFPFTDGAGARQRPALVLMDSGDADLLLARVTTQPCQTAFDCPLVDWAEAGLKAPSWARLHKLATLSKELVRKRLGSVSNADWEQVCRAYGGIQRQMEGRAAVRSHTPRFLA